MENSEQNDLSTRSKLTLPSTGCPSPTLSDDSNSTSNNFGDGDKVQPSNREQKFNRHSQLIGLNSFAPIAGSSKSQLNSHNLFPSRSPAHCYSEKTPASLSMDELSIKTKKQGSSHNFDQSGQIILREMSAPVENEFLARSLDKERKKVIASKIALSFVFKALRKRDDGLDQLRTKFSAKAQECAARLILHHMLLNSWRLSQKELKDASVENNHLHKTIENLSLQLRVVRHLHSTDRERSVCMNEEVNTLKGALELVKNENENMKLQLDQVSEERNALKSNATQLTEEKRRHLKELQVLKDKKEMLIRSLEMDKKRSDRYEVENSNLRVELKRLTSEIQELSQQNTKWKESSRSFEAECWQLKSYVEKREMLVQSLQSEKDKIEEERDGLFKFNAQLRDSYHQSSSKLEESINEGKKLRANLLESQKQVEELTEHVLNLKSTLQRLLQTNERMKTDLNDISLKNVRKRRAWANAFYYIFYPFETIKSICFGMSAQTMEEIRRESYQMLRNQSLAELRAQKKEIDIEEEEEKNNSPRFLNRSNTNTTETSI